MFKKTNAIIKQTRADNRTILTQQEAKLFALDLDIPCPPAYNAKDENDAIRIAEELGYPVILKALSSRILHKSDIGGVEKNLKNSDEVVRGYKKVLNSIKKIDKKAQVLVERMEPSGLEAIIGLITESKLGAVVMIGLGGILTEIFEDIAFRLAPIDEKQAKEAIDSLKTRNLFYGYRGQPPIDIDALIELLVKISRVPEWFEDIEQIDLNPIILYKDGLNAVDIKVVLKK